MLVREITYVKNRVINGIIGFVSLSLFVFFLLYSMPK